VSSTESHAVRREDALPDEEFEAAKEHAGDAQLALCLGTSLQITPACNIPLRTAKAGGKLVIVNLQATPKDKKADLVIHARCEVRALKDPLCCRASVRNIPCLQAW